ncbi:MAG TPA: ThiF family adenylyltransferase [Metabacillus sp.]|nr:ThiF family adenylyltransferase [Metabacillus sp.]
MKAIGKKQGQLNETDFYIQLIERNGTFVRQDVQEKLKSSCILVAGCGSTGGASIEPLVRLGATKFILADNGAYELNNLNRQSAFLTDLNRNKAEVMKDRILSINPYCEVRVYREGITEENVSLCVQDADIVIDGVDVTERAGWQAKWLLHEYAATYKRSVITGWDIGPTQYVQYFNYQNRTDPFYSKINKMDISELDIFKILYKVLPIQAISLEMLEDLERNWKKEEYHVPQIVYTSMLFGAISSRLVIDILAGKKLTEHAAIDLQSLFLSKGNKFKLSLKKYKKVLSLVKEL